GGRHSPQCIHREGSANSRRRGSSDGRKGRRGALSPMHPEHMGWGHGPFGGEALVIEPLTASVPAPSRSECRLCERRKGFSRTSMKVELRPYAALRHVEKG